MYMNKSNKYNIVSFKNLEINKFNIILFYSFKFAIKSDIL